MTDQQSSYRQILKTTSLFGGVQVFTILVSIVRSKFIAVLLGPAGMGIAGLINSTLRLIEGFSSFGLGTSAIKNVAAANSVHNTERLSTVVGTLRRLVWLTGLLGASVTFFLSGWLSQISFGNHDYSIAFKWVAMTLFFNQISVGQGVVLRGMQQVNLMAKATLLGSLLGLIVSIPLYYKFGIKGIVPAIIVSSLLSLLLTWYFAGKVSISVSRIKFNEAFVEGRDMLRMGFMLSLSGLIALGASYIVRVFISTKGGVDQVGLYNAGFAIINTYVGLVFNAMATDYFPRLSGVAHNNDLARRLINEQAEIAILILAPILTVFLVFINWIVIVLYSTKFIAINEMILWAALGIYFKAASFSIGYILLAKGASRLFLWNELASNLYLLAFNIIGYSVAGLAGLGISFMVGYFVHLVQVYLVTKHKYSFKFSKPFISVFISQLSLGLLCFITVRVFDSYLSYVLGALFIIASVAVTYFGLRNRIDLESVFQSILHKLKITK